MSNSLGENVRIFDIYFYVFVTPDAVQYSFMSEVRRMGFDNLRDAWRITDINTKFKYVYVHFFAGFFYFLMLSWSESGMPLFHACVCLIIF